MANSSISKTMEYYVTIEEITMPKKLDHNKIRNLIKENRTSDEIAIETNCDESTIRRLAHKWGIILYRFDNREYNKRTINYLEEIRNPKPKIKRQNEGYI